VLEALGTIRSSTGSGPNAGTIVTGAPEQALSLAFNLQLATRHTEHRHIAEMRLLLETWAALHSDAARGDWAEATRLLDLMDDQDLSVEQFLAYDAQFHVTISRAADNPLVSTIMEALRLSIAEHTAERARAVLDWSRSAERLRDEHRRILAALSSGDRETGAELLRNHIEGYQRETESGE
jgi:DNA-binding FadR family transcriptional regulator